MEKIVVANVYGGSNSNPSGLIEWLNNMDVDAALISEMMNLKDNLQSAGHVYGDGDVGTVLMGGVADGSNHVRITDFIQRGEPNPYLWRDRWYSRARRGQIVYFSVHGNAAIASGGKWLDNAGAREWRYKGLPRLREAIKEDMDRGFAVRVGGDMNFPKSDAPSSPNNFFSGLGLHYMHDAVMWLAWDPRTATVEKAFTLPIAPGADAHKVLRLNLSPKGDVLDDGGGGGGGSPSPPADPYNPDPEGPPPEVPIHIREGQASLGGVPFRINPTGVSWDFKSKVADIATVGGKVIQVFGTTMGDITVTGTFGRGGWMEQENFLIRMKALADIPVNDPKAKPIWFRFPIYGWDFPVYLKEYSSPDGAKAVVLNATNFSPKWKLVLFPVESSVKLNKIAQDAYLDRISKGLGWRQTKYNGPMHLYETLGNMSPEEYLESVYGIGAVPISNQDPDDSDVTPTGTDGTPGQNQAIGKEMAKGFGWTEGQWEALKELWTRESNWNHEADNKTSNAYGIPQAMISAHWPMPEGYFTSHTGTVASILNDENQTYFGGDPVVQIRWGLNYIKGRYGTPQAALNYHDANGVY